MDFDLNDDQKMLAKTVADFGKKESTVERFRKVRDAEGPGWEKAVWQKMGELGWLSVPFPEEVGGFGGSFVEVGLILEQLGKTLVPEPYLASVVLGGYPLLLGGTAEQQQRFLAPMIEGKTSLALAHREPARRFAPGAVATTATKDGEGWVLKGTKAWVPNGHAADQIVVAAKAEDGLGLFVVDGDAVERETLGCIDGHRAAHVKLDGVKVEADRRLSAKPAEEVLAQVLDHGAAGCVAEGFGLAQSMLWMTLDYLKTREQFGVKIGSFQALQHRSVDMFVEVELLKSVFTEAIARVDQGDLEARRAVSAAKLQLAQGGQFVSRQAIQLHGGIGVTDEADIGLFFKRMHSLVTLCGDEAFHVRRFAEEMDAA